MPLEIYHTFILSQRTSLVYTTFLAIAINKIAASLPFIGPRITALQAQPQCLTAVQWSTFTLRIPGGVVTGHGSNVLQGGRIFFVFYRRLR